MKKIGIDARLYFQTGVGVYLRNLLRYLQDLKTDNCIFNIYLMKDDIQKIEFKNENFLKKEVDSRWHSLSEQINFLKNLQDDDLDLVHFTYFSYPILYKKKFIATIHDVTPLYFKTGKASTKILPIYEMKHFFFRQVLNREVQNSEVVIAPTYTVKNQLITRFGEKYKSKIYPIYEGFNYELNDAKENTQLKDKFNNFFIYVGNFYPHKNVESLIKAFVKINQDVKLVLIGPNDYFAKKILQYNIKLKLNNRVIFHHSSKPEDLVFFYRNALALIHPSLSEGFGLPIVEAVNFNLPIIASNIDPFKELLEDKYISFDPYNIDDISKKINQFLNEKKKFNYDEILKKFSFKEMAKKTLQIYENVI